MPLPFGWVAWFSQRSALFYSQAAAVVTPKAVPGVVSLSVDAGVSGMMALKSAAYFCLYLLLLLSIDSRGRLRMLCYVIVCSGLFQSVYGSFMTLSGFEYLLGVKKTTYLGTATGTFVNRNHFAGYLEMALATGIGLMMVTGKNGVHESSRRWRGKLRRLLSLLLSGKAILRLILIAMVIGLILSRSRMGNAAFFNSLLITGLFACGVSSSFRRPGVYVLLISLVVIDIFLLGRWFGLEKVVERLEQTSLATEGRDDVLYYAVPMLKDFIWTGTGAGTFYYVFPQYAGEPQMSGYDHAHNDYLELLSDLGVIGFSALVGVVLLSLWQAIKALRHPRSSFVRGMGFAGFMGMLSLLIHSAVDFNLQIPANAMLFIAMLALPTIALSVDSKTIRTGI
jgi:O-antigen ligase